MALCDDVLRVAFCHAIAEYDETITLDSVPTLAWQAVGGDAILTGYNDPMIKWTGGNIEKALGKAASDFLRPATLNRLTRCIETGCPALYDSVRRLASSGERWHMLTLAIHDDDRILIYSQPLERMPERERERESSI